ncbi:MAG TPA: hypothetical protein VLH94_04275 [Spirochaetia bacterium]|nr:hypothetical protein [Spirochaetia bacterium]
MKYEYLSFMTDDREISGVCGGDEMTREITHGKMNFNVLIALGNLGWKMAGVIALHFFPETNGAFYFVREVS